MSIEPIGVVTILAGLICLQIGYLTTIQMLVVATLFGSAAAVLIGLANIQPAHLFLAFAAASTLSRRRELNTAIGALRFPEAGFWLLCLLIYGLITGVAMPRLFAGMTEIIPLGTSEYAPTGSTVPLGPVSSNYTQAIYLTGDFVCFALAVAVASTPSGFSAIANALLVYAAGNLLFALLDLVTYAAGESWILSFMRNAQYTIHAREEVSGLKRIVGSFTEAAAFARSTLGVLGFTGTLWLCGWRPTLTGSLAATSLVLLVLSTSSTGLAGAPLVLAILYGTLTRRGFHPTRPIGSTILLCAPLIAVAAVIVAQVSSEATEPIRAYINDLIFDKSITSSGIERSIWNTVALQNFYDSYGLGVGLGTVRTSSFPMALLSNVGVPGLMFYMLFAISAFAVPRGVPDSFPADVRLAARNACLGLIIGDTFSGTTVEQGLLFYVLAGLACAVPELYRADAPAPD